MADTEFFEIPADLPSGDAGVKIRALSRTVAGTAEKVGVTVIVDPTDPTIEADVDATYGLAVDIKRLPGTAPTAALQTTGNASLSSIDGKTPALGQALAAASVPVVLTAAQVSTLTPVAGLTDAQLRASAVPVSLATLPALTAGSAAIGKLAANSGVDIGDVDVTTLPVQTIKTSLSASFAVTIDLAPAGVGLASDTNLLAGREWTAIDNTSTQALDYLLAGKIRQGTSPTTGKEIRIYVVGPLNDSTWPDVFDGTDSAETVSSSGVRDSVCRLAAVMATNATSDFDNYFGPVSVASLFGGVLPRAIGGFVVHNTGVALNATSGNHVISVTPVFRKITA